MKALKTTTIVLFASGSGTNAENIIQYFQKNKTAVENNSSALHIGLKFYIL